ncbi:MAG: undecaprenyl-diphosphate phosphatase [Bacteroidia bacterium]
MSYFEALIIAIIEGLTEFLPVSSTGHIMIGTAILGIEPTPFVKLFTVAIQFGAILSVVVLYFRKFFQSFKFYYKLIFAFIPAAIAGLLLGDVIDAALENLWGVAIALFVGGVIMLFSDNLFKKDSISDSDSISYLTSLKIGICQCLALFPGVSRSGATIIGGKAFGLTKQLAAEFSFFLAVPTMFAATAKKTLDFFQDGNSITTREINILLFGNVVAFIVAIIGIKTLIGLLNKFGFKWFGVYRILLGAVLFLLFKMGYSLAIL